MIDRQEHKTNEQSSRCRSSLPRLQLIQSTKIKQDIIRKILQRVCLTSRETKFVVFKNYTIWSSHN
ncbi:hypothetical protein HanRHA438_Chr14g0671451 [Helianthus annuus]|nr:hypothetical protein HanIR_Chr14g0716611 [Helianthus annuus]KAJ0841720.1 hypothetical protein HanPSC8_Chr14g0633591 [Helianthus annuus]KAJ0855261.1 hypothetical protein HanRHA438_Chr14g0671451 [Helianthus annuus]